MKPFLLPLFVAFLAAGCKIGESPQLTPQREDCGPAIQLRDPLPRLTSDNFSVVDASVEDLCLSVTISATGCSSQGWEVYLHSTGAVMESYPTQTNALLVFDDGVAENEVTCQAIIEETYRFDLTPYLGQGALPTTFTLTGTDTSIAIE